MEIRRQQFEAMKNSKKTILKAYEEFNDVFGTGYGQPFLETYKTEDADVVLVGMGTVVQPGKMAVDRMRAKGTKAGFVRVVWFRPFPAEELRETLVNTTSVGVIDRDVSFGSPDLGGVLFNDVRAALYTAKHRPTVSNFVAGLGGREISIDDCERMLAMTTDASMKGQAGSVTWVGVRE
jgi:pyruvate ferredoxin oxidoreductase alpha subunit